MQFAINYSPQAEALLRAGKIEIDRFKFPDWPDQIAVANRYRPVYIHFTLFAGDNTIGNTDWKAIETMLTQTDTPCVNLHLQATTAEFPHIPVDSARPEHLTEVAERFIEAVTIVAERFGPERVIVENVVYRGPEGAALDAIVAPEVIQRVTGETGCGLLLDTAHATITAQSLEVPVETYLSALPVDRIREIHVTGVQQHAESGRLRDHLAMTERDRELFAWSMKQIHEGRWATPWVVAFEYGGIGPIFEWRSDPEVIASQTPRLYALAKASETTTGFHRR